LGVKPDGRQIREKSFQTKALYVSCF